MVMARRFQRRRFLRRGAILGVAGIAGCAAENQGTRDTSPTTRQSGPTERHEASEDTLLVVDPSGSDQNAGTEESPLRTIQEAIERAHPGETVFVRAGRYFESPETVRPGTKSAPITITGPPGAVISGREDAEYSKGFGVSHSHIHLEGLTIDGLQDPSHPDDPESYIDVAINILPHRPEYLTGLVLKPHAIGNTQGAMIKVNFVENSEIGEFKIIGPAGLGYRLQDEDGFFGEIIYIGSWQGEEFGDLEREGVLEGDDTSNNIHIHHIDNSEGHRHAEFVGSKIGTHDITIEYCTSRGGGFDAGYGRTISLQGHDMTIRWCDFMSGRGHGIQIGVDEIHRRQGEQDESKWSTATRLGGTGHEIHGNSVTGFDMKAFYFPFKDRGQGPEEQDVFCGNNYDGDTDGIPDGPCPESIPSADDIGHLGGDSPWA